MPKIERYEEFSELIRLYSSQMLAYIDSLLLNRSDAEDLFQDTCIVLWQKFDEFSRGTNFLAWALRIADYKVMNFQQKQSRRVAFVDSLRDALMAEVASREAEVASASLNALPNCMERLAQNDRRMVTLCYAEGESVRQLAHAMGRSPQSVHHSLRRIRNWLLECIQRELRKAEMSAPTSHNVSDKEDRI